jgi:hypothetical protein
MAPTMGAEVLISEVEIYLNKGCVTLCGLAIYIKKYLKAKEKLWKLKYFTIQKHNLQKQFFKRNQNLYKWVKAWLRYSKGLSHFIFTKDPHLNIMLKFNNIFILKF